MKKRTLAALALITQPVAALAHGAHPPLAEPAHGLSHAGPILALAVIALAGYLAFKRN